MICARVLVFFFFFLKKIIGFLFLAYEYLWRHGLEDGFRGKDGNGPIERVLTFFYRQEQLASGRRVRGVMLRVTTSF